MRTLDLETLKPLIWIRVASNWLFFRSNNYAQVSPKLRSRKSDEHGSGLQLIRSQVTIDTRYRTQHMRKKTPDLTCQVGKILEKKANKTGKVRIHLDSLVAKALNLRRNGA